MRSLGFERKTRILLYGIPTLVLVISTAYLSLPPQLKLFYFLDEAHLAEVEPNGTWLNLTCPVCGSRLEGIVIDPSDKVDGASRYVYYCANEDAFWVWYFPGGMGYARWYGPFSAYWKLTNAVATGTVIISCVALVLLAVRDKNLEKGRL